MHFHLKSVRLSICQSVSQSSAGRTKMLKIPLFSNGGILAPQSKLLISIFYGRVKLVIQCLLCSTSCDLIAVMGCHCCALHVYLAWCTLMLLLNIRNQSTLVRFGWCSYQSYPSVWHLTIPSCKSQNRSFSKCLEYLFFLVLVDPIRPEKSQLRSTLRGLGTGLCFNRTWNSFRCQKKLL